MPSVVEIGLVDLKKKIEMWKVYDSNNHDDGQIFFLSEKLI